MITDKQAQRLLRSAALSVALLLTAAPAALAGEGYLAATGSHAASSTAIVDRTGVPLSGAGQACANIGFDQRGRAFSQCAADLDATLWNQNNLAAR